MIRWKPGVRIAGRLATGGIIPWDPAFEGQDARYVPLNQPYVAVQSVGGRVYIADKAAHAVRMVDEVGDIHTVAGTGQSGNGVDGPMLGTHCMLSYPNALWAHPSGRIYILDLNNSKVRCLEPNGRIHTVLALPWKVVGGRGLQLSPDEQTIYVASKNRILRFSKQEGLSSFARGFEDLGHLLLDGPDVLWAADRGGQRVYRVDASGKKPVAGDPHGAPSSTPVDALKGGLLMPRALAYVPGQGLLVGTQEGCRVYLIDPQARMHLLLDGKNPQAKLQDPRVLKIKVPIEKLRALTLSPQGDLLLTHGDAGQVIRFRRAA